MFRPSRSIVLHFSMKKKLPWRYGESLGSRGFFSMGINCMALAVWLEEDRKMLCGCSMFRVVFRVIYGTVVLLG